MKLRFFGFCASSLLGFAVDNSVFALTMSMLSASGMWRRNAILVSLLAARVISSFVNYLVNRRLVFRSQADGVRSVGRYYALVAAIMTASYLLTSGASAVLDAKGLVITGIKIVIETVLFIVSFRAQRDWVYVSAKGEKGE